MPDDPTPRRPHARVLRTGARATPASGVRVRRWPAAPPSADRGVAGDTVTVALEPAGASAARHLHVDYEIACVDCGHGTLLHHGGARAIARAHLVIVPPGDAHAVAGATGLDATECGGVRRLMWVGREFLHRQDGHGGAAPAALLPPTVVAAPALIEQFRALHDRLLWEPLANGGAAGERIGAELAAFLHALVACIDAERSATRRAAEPGTQVARARTYLQDHWADPFSLDALARVACYSKQHLVYAFRRAYGLPPRAYQTRLRLAHAQESLARGEPITGVAYETGFADQAHLTRAFKQVFGMTPGGWAANRTAPTRGAAAPAAAA